MPLVDFDTADIYEELYGGPYTRERKSVILGNDHWRLLEVLGISQSHKIALIGCGFGWMAEDWMERGFNDIICVDNGKWIQQYKNKEAILPIEKELPENLYDWIITEDMIGTLSNQECLTIAEKLRRYGPVYHWTACRVEIGAGDLRLNWKSLEGWYSLLQPDKVIARNEDGRML